MNNSLGQNNQVIKSILFPALIDFFSANRTFEQKTEKVFEKINLLGTSQIPELDFRVFHKWDNLPI